MGKVAYNKRDGTQITFTSSEFIQQCFDGVLMVRLSRAEFSSDQQEQLVERLLSGSEIDPYITAEVIEGSGQRTMDTAVSSVKVRDKLQIT